MSYAWENKGVWTPEKVNGSAGNSREVNKQRQGVSEIVCAVFRVCVCMYTHTFFSGE